MAFKKVVEQEDQSFTKISDIPLLKVRCTEKGFCKSGLFEVEHLIPPAQFTNFTLINYTLNVRVNVSEKNTKLYEMLLSYLKNLKADPNGVDSLWVQIRDRDRAYINLGVDDEKAVNWSKHALGHIKT
jgi:hypothetical protein